MHAWIQKAPCMRQCRAYVHVLVPSAEQPACAFTRVDTKKHGAGVWAELAQSVGDGRITRNCGPQVGRGGASRGGRTRSGCEERGPQEGLVHCGAGG
jgi:hypothetical protein